MERTDSRIVLRKIMNKNNFSIIERLKCHSDFESKLRSMQNIFDLKEKNDFTYLYAVAELLSDNPDEVKDFLLDENSDCNFAEGAAAPERKDKLLVATAMEENIGFYSMAWNWVSIVEKRIAKNLKKSNSVVFDFKSAKIFNVHEFISVSAAGTPGFNNMTKVPIDGLGYLKVMGNEETKRLLFAVFLNDETKSKKFEISISFEINGEEKSASILKDYEDEEDDISSDPIHVDFSKGFKIIDISYKPL